MVLERNYQSELIAKIERQYPGVFVLKNDSSYIQGIPDWLFLYGLNWAALEIKKSADAPVRPNQPYYVDLLNKMSYAKFAYPENEREVLRGIQRAFTSRR